MSSSKPYACFALFGDDFVPQKVTDKLKIEPTSFWKKGDKRQFLINQKLACWMWSTEKGKEEIFLDNLVNEVVEKFRSKVEIINKLKSEFQLTSVLVIVMEIDSSPEKSTPALGHDLITIEFLYLTQTTTDVDIYIHNSLIG